MKPNMRKSFFLTYNIYLRLFTTWHCIFTLCSRYNSYLYLLSKNIKVLHFNLEFYNHQVSLYQQVSFHLSKIFQIFAFHILSNNSYTKTFSPPEFLKQYIFICCTQFVMISYSKVTFIHTFYILLCFAYILILPLYHILSISPLEPPH